MKTLDEHNKARLAFYERKRRKKYKYNVACPKCGLKMFYPTNMIIVTGQERREIACKCGFTGELIL